MIIEVDKLAGNNTGEYIEVAYVGGFATKPSAIALSLHVDEGDKIMSLNKETALKLGNEILRLANELE